MAFFLPAVLPALGVGGLVAAPAISTAVTTQQMKQTTEETKKASEEHTRWLTQAELIGHAGSMPSVIPSM